MPSSILKTLSTTSGNGLGNIVSEVVIISDRLSNIRHVGSPISNQASENFSFQKKRELYKDARAEQVERRWNKELPDESTNLRNPCSIRIPDSSYLVRYHRLFLKLGGQLLFVNFSFCFSFLLYCPPQKR